MTQPTDLTGPGHDAHEDQHQANLWVYLYVTLALCVLTSASFFTYSDYWPFGEKVGWAFMMAVSCTKAMLVILFFMHLLHEANWKYVLTIPAAFMSIFLVLMLVPDVGLRMRRASEERKLYMAPPQTSEDHDDDASSEPTDDH
jgi:cytochrome c oxidase subunit 4